MSGIKYEITDRNLKDHKHTFDYDFCKSKYEEYARMTFTEFKECLKDPIKIGEIGHLSSFVLWVKNIDQDEYRDTLSDYGLIHLLFHCLENKEEANKHAIYIHQLFKEDIKLS